jgi:hypothetical protein
VQAVSGMSTPGLPAGVRSGRAGLVRVVRLLTAACLLGVAVVIVALAGQGVAAARGLPAPDDVTGTGGQPVARVAGQQPVAAAGPAVPASPGAGGLVEEYVEALNLTAQELSRPEPVPGNGAQAAAARGAQPDSRRPADPGTRSETAADLGRWWRPQRQPDGHLVVADVDGPDGRATPPRLATAAPVPPVGSMTVAELTAQAPRPEDQPIRLFMAQVTEDADRLAGTMSRLSSSRVGDRPRALAGSARTHAAEASAQAGDLRLSDAPATAKSEIRSAAADLRKLVNLALGEADKLGEADLLVQEAEQLRADARDAAAAVAVAESQAAVATDAAPPDVLPANVSPTNYPVRTIVDTVVDRTKALLPRTEEAMERLQVDRRDREEAAGLIADAERRAANAKDFAGDAPISARDEMNAVIAKLRRVGGLADKVADNMDGEGRRLRQAAELATQVVDYLEAQVGGGDAQPAPAGKGTELVPETPAPDTPANRLAGDSDEPVTPTAAVEGQSAAAQQPGAVADGTDGTEAHTREVLPAGVPGDDGRHAAATGEAGEDTPAASTAPPPTEVAGGDGPGAGTTAPVSLPVSENVAAADPGPAGDGDTGPPSSFGGDMFTDLADPTFADVGV